MNTLQIQKFLSFKLNYTHNNLQERIFYTIDCDNSQQHFIKIKVQFPVDENKTIIHLPSWRPGRYELGNFAKNIKNFKVFNDQNKAVNFHKINKDSWEISSNETKYIKIEYQYYANELNAGSSYFDEQQLYVNPVNCFLYAEGKEQFPISLELNIPKNYTIANSLVQENNFLLAENFDELADSPFICSENLEKQTYSVADTNFHIWFNNQLNIPWERVIDDFRNFTKKQIEDFGEFPVSEYHFLIQSLPYLAYHGVEHLKSTVITLGPSYDLFENRYDELLGVSSHELYHVWNVKSIRPKELLPYNFKKENYSELGYIYEGITTYLGDLYLLKSAVFSLENYLKELSKQFQKHFDNPGRFAYSVAQSSYDTWLDGYDPGAPGRKVSIYTEGCLLAFVIDVKIRKATNNKLGIEEVMKRLYYNFAQNNKGYTEKDFIDQLENICGYSFQDFFNDYVHGTTPYETILLEALDFIGLELIQTPSNSYSEANLGMKTIHQANHLLISAIYPGSPAEMAGLSLGDELIALNTIKLNYDLDSCLNYFDASSKTLSFFRNGKLLQLTLPEVNRFFYLYHKIHKKVNLTPNQEKAIFAWSENYSKIS
jgi:predicted metalloprotease with PDZ domain